MKYIRIRRLYYEEKLLVLVALLLMASMVFTACGGGAGTTPEELQQTPAAETPAEETPAEETPAETPADSGDKPYIAIISRVSSISSGRLYQRLRRCSKRLNVDITFDGPPSESDIQVQLDRLNAALGKNPDAVAALDTESVTAQLLEAKEKGIPVIGFDSGVPNAPEGTIVSTASTDNEKGGAIAAEEIFKVESVKQAIENATPDNPVVLGVISQDATSASVVGRTVGFLTKAKELAEAIHPGGVAITGHDKYNEDAEGDMVVELHVQIPPTTNIQDGQAAAQAMLEKKNLVAVFMSNDWQ